MNGRLAMLLMVWACLTGRLAVADRATGAAPRTGSPTWGLADFLPVHTPSMQPGPVRARRERTGVTRPLFLLGADQRSRTWLAANRERLQNVQAVGLVVEVADRAAFETLTALAGELSLVPVPGAVLAAHFSLRHYPVLITPAGISP